MRKESTKSAGSLVTVTNALRLLSLLTSQPSLRVVDVSETLGIAASTAHRLLRCLKEEGFLKQESGSRSYTIGPEMLRMARHFSTGHTLERAARPQLEALCRDVNEAVNLQILLGPEALCIDAVAEHRHTLHVKQIVNRRTPAYASAAGKLLLSALAPQEVEAVYRDGLRPITPATITDLHALQRDLVAVRSRGYSTNLGEGEEGIHAVAVGILDLKQSPMAALSVAAPASRLPTARMRSIARKLHQAGAEITRAFFAMADAERPHAHA